MGARKQRWSEEEEKTLKAGIQKYGAGKWTAILKDPDFKPILCARSNIDLKDKFRNMNVVRTGGASREKAMGASKRSKQNLILYNNHVTVKSNSDDLINEMNDCMLLTRSTDSELSDQNKEKSSLELVILEAVACSKGSSLASIASYIADNVKVVRKSQKAIGENLKAIVEAGKLVKVHNGYKLGQNADLSKGRSPKVKPIEANLNVPVKSGGDLKNVSKSSNNARLSRSDGDLEKVSITIMSEVSSKLNGDVNVSISSDNDGSKTDKDRTAHEAAAYSEGLQTYKDMNVHKAAAYNERLPTYEDRTAHEAAAYNEGLPTYKDMTVHKAATYNEVLSTYEDMTAHEAAADKEGLPTYEERTAPKAAEAIAMAEVSRAEYREALARLKLAKTFVSASHSLLEKLSIEMSRRNAKMKVRGAWTVSDLLKCNIPQLMHWK